MTIYESSLKIDTYYVVEQSFRNGTGDVFPTYYESRDDALAAAEAGWNHLTPYERTLSTISAYRLEQRCIQDDLIDDDKPWWTATADREETIITY